MFLLTCNPFFAFFGLEGPWWYVFSFHLSLSLCFFTACLCLFAHLHADSCVCYRIWWREAKNSMCRVVFVFCVCFVCFSWSVMELLPLVFLSFNTLLSNGLSQNQRWVSVRGVRESAERDNSIIFFPFFLSDDVDLEDVSLFLCCCSSHSYSWSHSSCVLHGQNASESVSVTMVHSSYSFRDAGPCLMFHRRWWCCCYRLFSSASAASAEARSAR